MTLKNKLNNLPHWQYHGEDYTINDAEEIISHLQNVFELTPKIDIKESVSGQCNKIVTLVLNEEKANWLKGLMQNPIFVENPQDESNYDKSMRKEFWILLGGNL